MAHTLKSPKRKIWLTSDKRWERREKWTELRISVSTFLFFWVVIQIYFGSGASLLLAEQTTRLGWHVKATFACMRREWEWESRVKVKNICKIAWGNWAHHSVRTSIGEKKRDFATAVNSIDDFPVIFSTMQSAAACKIHYNSRVRQTFSPNRLTSIFTTNYNGSEYFQKPSNCITRPSESWVENQQL